jgi:tRNA(adenine34) deaminase
MKPMKIYMQEVLSLAGKAIQEGELPIAAMVILDDEILAKAYTTEKREKCFLGHAEFIVLEAADKQNLSYQQRPRATLITNLEPCLICLGAAMSFFLGEIVYGLESPGDGAVEMVKSWVRQEDDFLGYQVPRIIGGLMREESKNLFQEYVNRHEPGPMRDWAETLTKLG